MLSMSYKQNPVKLLLIHISRCTHVFGLKFGCVLRFCPQRLGSKRILTLPELVDPRYTRMIVLGEEQIEVLDMILREQRPELAMFDIPLEQLNRKCFLELLDIRFDTRCVRVLLWGIDLAFMA